MYSTIVVFSFLIALTFQMSQPADVNMTLDLRSLRPFLGQPAPPLSWRDIGVAAFVNDDPGAVQLVDLCRLSRGNDRTRKPLWRFRREFLRVNTVGFTGKPRRWLGDLLKSALAVYRAMRVYAFPVLPRHGDRSLAEVLRRKTRRAIGRSGVVAVDLPSLQDRADVAGRQLWRDIVGSDVVMWVDNWYWQRFGTDPEDQNKSQDVTAMAVLRLSFAGSAPAARTRSQTFRMWPGQSSLLTVVGRMDGMDTGVSLLLQSLVKKVSRLVNIHLCTTDIRVPLDVPRAARLRQQWQALALSTQRVSAGAELLQVLADVVKVQRRTGGVMPLLVDEKVHHQVMRLMYSPVYWDWDGAGWLRQVPVLYGTWHAYKQTVTLVYRHFLPIFTALELEVPPPAGAPFKATRKTVFMERMVAAVLLASGVVRQQVEVACSGPRSPSVWK